MGTNKILTKSAWILAREVYILNCVHAPRPPSPIRFPLRHEQYIYSKLYSVIVTCEEIMARTKISIYIAPLTRDAVGTVNGGIKQKKVRSCIVQPVDESGVEQKGFTLHITKQHRSELKEYINTVHRLDVAYERLARKWNLYDVHKRMRKLQTLTIPPPVLQCCSSFSTCVCNQEVFKNFLQRVCKRTTLASAVYQLFLKRGHARMYARMNS